MKKIILLIILLSFGCIVQKNIIISSIKPVYLISNALWESELLIPPNSNPHLWDPSVIKTITLKTALIYIRVAPDFEVWDSDLEKPYTINMSDCTKYKNPHLWLDPDIAKCTAKKIRDVLVKKFPNKNKEIDDRLNKLYKEIDEVNNYIKLRIKKKGPINYVAYNPAFTHFAKHYGLNEIAIVTTQGEPSLKRINEIIELMKKKNIHCIFISKMLNDDIAKQIAIETNSKIIYLDPLGEDAITYPEILLNMWKEIEKC